MYAIVIRTESFFALRQKVRELSRAAGSEGGDVDDSEYVRRALGGDHWAEEVLYRKHVVAVATLVTRLLARSQEAEDVVQEAFLTAFRDLRNLRQAESFRSWLMQIAVRLVHRHFQRRRVLRALGLDRGQDDATLLSEADPSATPETRAELSRVDELLRRMPAHDRVAWILRYVEGHRLDEVATLCRCSLATAKRRITRAHTKITEQITIEPWEDG
jgi:RNA polymerase sigma-70 factor (ECF subfamily)